MNLTPERRRLAAELTRDKAPQGMTYWRCEPGVIAAVAVGAAEAGHDLASVTYRGVTQEAAYLDSYIPTVGHTVAVLASSDGSLLILGRIVGTPV